ncbi:hypothetical protein CEN49_04405 [Fischerella thermalis CCMEE 5273]|uniref:Uncharacterized protein n=1 Tax=Chlorogloeopsis fritschii PCC 6912 TaxID=211165 RepID=A0A3S1FQQ1_CHLFR|nr:hypothetical protein [Chlorogloeopsis fritschii]PMB10302.1 hypothetical protein CEN49_04405 [Fischerella thermalis CCMEE 5273]RUR83768.1 hypothetical protein PCC6912_20110 [Chlorogloeopsis fritschii PCC 6912]
MDNTMKKAGIIFMKVGLHAQENIEDIIKRKQREFEETGSIFWGYGGNTCHPLTMVQPFAKEVEKSGNEVLIVMQKMNSRHAAPPEIAKQYSDDGVNWQPIPKGIEVRGSRYALVLDELRVKEFDLDLGELQVGVGPSRGRKADKYLVGRADKGCFLYAPHDLPVTPDEQTVKRIEIVARVKTPYAVFLKN